MASVSERGDVVPVEVAGFFEELRTVRRLRAKIPPARRRIAPHDGSGTAERTIDVVALPPLPSAARFTNPADA
jgi:hypothetical protein